MRVTLELEFHETINYRPFKNRQVLSLVKGEWRILKYTDTGWLWNGGVTDPPNDWAYLPEI